MEPSESSTRNVATSDSRSVNRTVAVTVVRPGARHELDGIGRSLEPGQRPRLIDWHGRRAAAAARVVATTSSDRGEREQTRDH